MKTYLITILTITILFAASTVGLAQGLDTPSALLPPDGDYISPDQYHEYSAMGIILDDPIHRPFVGTTIREAIGSDELETFDSLFTAVEIGQGLGDVSLTGPVQVITHNRALSTTGTFATEIVSMSLSGNTPMGLIMIREAPNLASTGSTDITDLGGGLYHIDSFFDVFTELSVDGGGTWIACDYATRMSLEPEPATLGLLLAGGLALLRRRR